MYLSNSELRQLDLLKQKTPTERFILMVQLIQDQFELMKAGIRYMHPRMKGKDLEICLKDRIIKIYSLKH